MKEAVAVIIKNDNSEVLLAKRGRGEDDQVGKWENIGGNVMKGEDAETAIRREAKEELNLELINLNVLFVDTADNYKITVFESEIKGNPQIKEQDMIEEFSWVGINNIANYDLASYTKTDFIRLGFLKK